MRQNFSILCLILTLAALLCVPAYAAGDDPVPEPDGEAQNEIFQCGASSGPQTLPGASAIAEEPWEAELETRLISAWESGWNAIKDTPLSEQQVYYFDVSDLNIYYPGSGADETVRQPYTVFQTALSRVVNDNPETLFYSGGWGFESKSDTDKWFGPYDAVRSCWLIKYIALRYQEFGGLTGAEAEERFQAAMADAVAQASGAASRVEQLLILHDSLIARVNYNYEVAHDLPAPTMRIYGAYGALVDGNAVCNGYTLAFQALLNRLEIPNAYVVSDPVENMTHAWNLAEIDGDWYHIDTTWDDGAEGSCHYKYFLLSDETFQEIHNPYNSWSAPLPPAVSKRYESGWFFNGAKSSVYRWQGAYYTVRSSKEVFTSGTLHAQGTNQNSLGRDLHILPGGSCVWDNGCLYYIYWNNSSRKTLMAYHLDSSHYIQAGAFDSGGASSIGLRLEDGRITPIDYGSKGRPALGPGTPLLPPQALEGAEPVAEGWNDHFPVYYRGGRFYTVNTEMDGIYTKKLTVTASNTLGAQGTNPDGQDRNLQLRPYYGILWLGGYLYYIDWGDSELETLMAFQLDTGRIIQIGQFDKGEDSWFGIRYDEGEKRVTAYRGQEDLASFPVLPEDAPSGITVFDDGAAALAQASAGQMLWTASYTAGGRMAQVRQETLVQPDTYWYFGTLLLDGVVVPLRQGSDRVRVFLLDARCAPVCPAA